jgi:hypothetical protein
MEKQMAQKLKKGDSRHENHFPPEADGIFDVVPTHEIEQWRKKLNAQYGIGAGKLTIIEEPAEIAG